MVKRVDKSLNKDKNQSSQSQDTQEDDSKKGPDSHMCTGNFQQDFTELCRKVNMAVIPPVVLRPKPPPPPGQVPETKPEKSGKEKGGKPPPPPEPEIEPELLDENAEPPPKTYIVKDKFEYFKPCIQVEMENSDKLDSVTEIFIRGWRIDNTMMDIFRQCWPVMEKLHTINLWHTGLTGEIVSTLALCLQNCANIRNVVLDGNLVKEENWSELMVEDSLIQHLSLQSCHIGDKGARDLGHALGNLKKFNSKLCSLNLACNNISHVGAEHIAAGLRMNRSLLSLSLASNSVGDRGACSLGEALSRFPLSHEEVVERRRLLSEKGSPERAKSPPPGRRADSKDRPGSVRSGTHAEKGEKQRKEKLATKGKKEVKTGKEAKEKDEDKKGGKKDKEGGTKKGKGQQSDQDITPMMKLSSISADAGKTTGKSKDKRKDKKPSPVEQEHADIPDFINPLLEVTERIDDRLWVPGNRILINLNLSRNKIGETGVAALLKAVQYQTTLATENKANGTGLMRLCLTNNLVPADHELMKKLTANMVPKDPFYKSPENQGDGP